MKLSQIIKQLIAVVAISILILPNYSYSNPAPDFYKQVDCLATNIYFESRGEPIKGQIAVALVTLNRVADSAFPDTVCEVVYQGNPAKGKCQFSWYCDNKSDKIPRHAPEKQLAILIAILVMTTPIRDITNGALYFNTSAKKKHPNNIIKIGAHIFY